jgi:hypothetical protein
VILKNTIFGLLFCLIEQNFCSGRATRRSAQIRDFCYQRQRRDERKANIFVHFFVRCESTKSASNVKIVLALHRFAFIVGGWMWNADDDGTVHF